mgnify:CR=1 FL=1
MKDRMLQLVGCIRNLHADLRSWSVYQQGEGRTVVANKVKSTCDLARRHTEELQSILERCTDFQDDFGSVSIPSDKVLSVHLSDTEVVCYIGDKKFYVSYNAACYWSAQYTDWKGRHITEQKRCAELEEMINYLGGQHAYNRPKRN